MSVNLVESIQKNLGLPALQKVNPNTNDIQFPTNNSKADRLTQASVPAVIIAFYKLTRSPGGADKVLRGRISTSWLDELFGYNADRAAEAIAEYGQVSIDTARVQVESISEEVVQIIKKYARDTNAVISMMTDQRSHTLNFLPAGLHIGRLLNDSTIDDRTERMRGPISNLMHTIEEKFSGSDQSTPSQT